VTPGAISPDQAARERIRHSLHESLLVEASAGTGKTSELVRRMVNVLQNGLTTIDRIVAVTFTNKAAGELKLRLRQELDRQRTEVGDPQQAANLQDALAHLEEASIGTIHAFCAQILRERPVEARVDPDFEELDESSSRRVYAAVFRRWMQRKLNEDSPGLRRALARLSAREERDLDYTPIESIQNAGWNVIEWRDFPHQWSRPPLAREEIIDQLCTYVHDFAPRLNKYNADMMEPVRDILPWVERDPRDYDMLEAFFFRILRKWKRGDKKPPDQRLLDALVSFRPVADADLAAQLRAELWELVGLYNEAKRCAGQLDFVDLLLLVRNLVRDHAGVRAYLQRKYTHLFVDEFQDTDPLQAEIILLLAADNPAQSQVLKITPTPGKLFLVGDPQQSIYKFRRADLQQYQALRVNLRSKGVGVVRLSRSFRSIPGIQKCVNAAFASELNGDLESAQADHVPLEPCREPIPDQPAIVALPMPSPYGVKRLSNEAIDACQPATVTGYVEWLIKESGWKVSDSERPGELVAIKPRHICLLFRRFTNFGRDLTRDYVRSLEDRGIAHLLVGSKTYHSREEIDTIRAALTAVEWPEDELAVFATLKGALFAISDSVLLRFRHEYRTLHPFQTLPETLHPDYVPVQEALAILSGMHRQRNQRPIAETVYLLLEAARAWSAFAFRPAGNQVLANVRRVIDLARQFETSGGLSFRGFVEELTAQAERAESAEAPVLEEGADGVRIMTVHAAKGLEFPIVLLCDMTARIAHDNPDKYVESSGLCAMRLLRCAPLELVEHEDVERGREHAEGVRVAYVAATRARDLLVVPVVGDAERPGWVEPLNKAVYPAKTQFRLSAPAQNCPPFGKVSVLVRPAEYREETSVRPGSHRAAMGGHEVIWWDPAILPASREELFSDRQKEIFADEKPAIEAGLAAHRQWEQQRTALLSRGAQPSIELLLASEAAELPADFQGPVFTESTARPSNRPSGKRFGALIHNTLRDVPLDASRAQIEATAQLHARLIAATPEERDAASLAVLSALRHPLLERARAASRLHREYPVTLHAGKVLEGVIDLAFLEADHWVIIDFKSDADDGELLTRYAAQISWYAAAIEKIFGMPVQSYLLAV